jgi:hypothetical protein
LAKTNWHAAFTPAPRVSLREYSSVPALGQGDRAGLVNGPRGFPGLDGGSHQGKPAPKTHFEADPPRHC